MNFEINLGNILSRCVVIDSDFPEEVELLTTDPISGEIIAGVSPEQILSRDELVDSNLPADLRTVSEEYREYMDRRSELESSLSSASSTSDETDEEGDVERRSQSISEMLERVMKLRNKNVDPQKLTPIFPSVASNPQEEAPGITRGPYYAPIDPNVEYAQLISNTLDQESARSNILNALIHLAQNATNALLTETALGLGTMTHIHDRKFENNILRQPFSFERQCANGLDCVGKVLGDILVECLEPDQIKKLAEGQDVPRQLCLRCKRSLAQKIYMKIQHQGFREGSGVRLVNFCNIVEVPGQYKMQQCIFLAGYMLVVAENPRLYDRVWNNEEQIYYHRQTRYLECTAENRLTGDDFQRDGPPPNFDDDNRGGNSDSSNGHNELSVGATRTSAPSQNYSGFGSGSSRRATDRMAALYSGDFDGHADRYIPPERNGLELPKFLKAEIGEQLPMWVIQPFGAGATDYYRKSGEFVWRPLRFPSSNHTLYVELVNRVDYCERLLRSGRVQKKCVEMALNEWLNCHIPLVIYLSETGEFSNEAILRTKDIWPRDGVGFGQSSTPDTALHVLHCSFWGPSPIPMFSSTDLILIHYFIKALPLPCYARSFSNTVKKSWTNDSRDAILIDCLSRILACGLLGVYSHVNEIPSFHVRYEVHKWFVFDQTARDKDQFTCWVSENGALFTTLLREWVMHQLGSLPGVLAYFRKVYWWCAITRFVYDCANETRIALTRDSDPYSRRPHWKFRFAPGSTHQYKIRVDRPLRWKRFGALLKEYSTRSRRRIPKVVLLNFPAMVCSIADQMEIAAAKMNLRTLPWAAKYADLDGLRVLDDKLNMTDNRVIQRESGSGRKNKLSIGKVKFWPTLQEIYEERCVVQESMRIASCQLSCNNLSFETLALSLGVSPENTIIPLMHARDEYEAETDRSKITDVLLDIRLRRPRDYSILVEIFRSQLDAEKIQFTVLPKHFCDLQAAKAREIYGLQPDDQIPPFAGLYGVCMECGIFKGKMVGKPESKHVSLIRMNSRRATSACEVIRWARIFAPSDSRNKKPTRQSTKKERLRLKKRRSLMLAAKKVSSVTSKRERLVMLQTEKSSEIRDIIYNPMTGVGVCKRTLGRNRAFMPTSATKLAELQKTRDRWDAFIHTLIKQHRRDEIDARCKKSRVVTVNMLGRLLISQKDGYIALCCDCLCPFKCSMINFDERSVLVCGCKEAETDTKCVDETPSDRFRTSAQRKRDCSECCFPTCTVAQIDSDLESERTLTLNNVVFDDKNQAIDEGCGVLRRVAFCRRHSYAVKENARRGVIRLSTIVKAYQQHYRLVELKDGAETHFVYVTSKKPQMVRI